MMRLIIFVTGHRYITHLFCFAEQVGLLKDAVKCSESNGYGSIRDICLARTVTSGLTESRKTNTDSVMMTTFCLTKRHFKISRFYIKINNGNTCTFKQIV